MTRSEFDDVAARVIDAALDRDPVAATYLGDHRRDALLPDPSVAAAQARTGQLRSQLAQLAALETEGDLDDTVDVDVLTTRLAAELLDLDDIREAEWNPMLHNPGPALYALVSRPFAPLGDRIEPLGARLRAVPEYLVAARHRLGVMSRPHVETALRQLDGTVSMLDHEIPAAAHEAGMTDATFVAAVATARAAVVDHQRWLGDRVEAAAHDPRLGPELFAAKLALTLDTGTEPDRLLAAAKDELDVVTAELVEVAGRRAGVARPDLDTVRAELAELGRDVADDATIVGLCAASLAAATRFTRDHDLVTVYGDPVDVAAMPEIERGVAAAHCRESGPLEAAVLPTEVRVSPTPREWSPDQVASFYREYNTHLVHDLMVHEGVPGHALQLMHANRGGTTTRAVFGSGTFIEGWAVYAEELMVASGYRAESRDAALALQMQQLKMALRSILNAVLDIRFHTGELTERDAMAMMTGIALQERSEAAGKWRRVQLTSAQLCTYYVGWREIRRLAADLRAARPDWTTRARHDAMLAHGSPAPRHLRRLLGLAPNREPA